MSVQPNPPSFQDRPVDRLLDRLHRWQRRGPDRWVASCPCSDHERGDRSRGLSIRELPDGKVAVYCHAFPDEHDAYAVVAAVGLDIKDLFPATPERPYVRPVRPSPTPVPRSVGKVLFEAARFPESWEVCQTLAKLEPEVMKQDVLGSWDYLSDRYDIPAVLDLARIIRGVALFRYGTAKGCEDPKHVARCVDRLVEELGV